MSIKDEFNDRCDHGWGVQIGYGVVSPVILTTRGNIVPGEPLSNQWTYYAGRHTRSIDVDDGGNIAIGTERIPIEFGGTRGSAIQRDFDETVNYDIVVSPNNIPVSRIAIDENKTVWASAGNKLVRIEAGVIVWDWQTITGLAESGPHDCHPSASRLYVAYPKVFPALLPPRRHGMSAWDPDAELWFAPFAGTSISGDLYPFPDTSSYHFLAASFVYGGGRSASGSDALVFGTALPSPGGPNVFRLHPDGTSARAGSVLEVDAGAGGGPVAVTFAGSGFFTGVGTPNAFDYDANDADGASYVVGNAPGQQIQRFNNFGGVAGSVQPTGPIWTAEWGNQINGNPGQVRDVAVDDNTGNLIVCGTTEVGGVTHRIYDKDGNVLESYAHGGQVYNVGVDNGGNFYVTGEVVVE